MLCRRMVLSLTLVGLCVCLAQAAMQRQERRREQERQPMTPERFVQIASAAGIAEVAFGKLAADQASMDDVRKFGRQMVEDHTKANKELASIAESKQIPIAKQMDAKHKDIEQRLTRLSGPQFDREYVMAQVKDHEDAVALFSSFSQNGQDRELRSFATQTLPKLKEHLSMIQEIAAKIKRTP
jgi:putative membrane protein